MFNSPFVEKDSSIEELKKEIVECDIIFVADMFAEQYAGGAELTTRALIETSGDLKVCKINSAQLTMDILGLGVEKYWIFTNFSGMNQELIPAIIAILLMLPFLDFKLLIFLNVALSNNTSPSASAVLCLQV